MADTARSVAALQALLADNITGKISPQDVRDFLVTTLGVYGGIAWDTNTTGQGFLAGAGFEKTLNSTQDISASSGVTPVTASDKITCPIAGDYQVHANISCSSSVANVVVHASVFVNGVEQTDVSSERKISSGGDVGAWSFSGPLSIGAGEDVDIRFDLDKDAVLTVTHGQLWLQLVG